MDAYEVVERVEARLLELDMQFSKLSDTPNKEMTRAKKKRLEETYDLYNQNFKIYYLLTGKEFVPPSKGKMQ